MKIFTARLTRRRAAAGVIALGVVSAGVILLAGRVPEGEVPVPIQLASNDQRVEYLRSLGWELEAEPVETLQFLLPEALEEPYLTYNELQTAQGMDLSAACGRQVSRYTYTVLNYPGRAEGVQLNLYVCGETPVAGDIFCAGADGFQAGLAYPAEASPDGSGSGGA